MTSFTRYLYTVAYRPTSLNSNRIHSLIGYAVESWRIF